MCYNINIVDYLIAQSLFYCDRLVLLCTLRVTDDVNRVTRRKKIFFPPRPQPHFPRGLCKMHTRTNYCK